MNSREERLLRGRALYLSVYESQGAIWEANECKELWCEKADRYLELAGNGNAQRPLIPEGFMLLPIEPTAMMALRGYQTTDVFEKGDFFGDYIDADELPAALAPTHKFDDDERGWMLAAAAYRGCVAGYLETQRRLAEDPTDKVAIGWNNPIATPVTSTER